MGWRQKIIYISTRFTKTSILPVWIYYLHILRHCRALLDRGCSSGWLPEDGGKRYSCSCHTAALSPQPVTHLVQCNELSLPFGWCVYNPRNKSDSFAAIKKTALFSEELVTALSSKRWQAYTPPSLQQAFHFGWALLNKSCHFWFINSQNRTTLQVKVELEI